MLVANGTSQVPATLKEIGSKGADEDTLQGKGPALAREGLSDEAASELKREKSEEWSQQ